MGLPQINGVSFSDINWKELVSNRNLVVNELNNTYEGIYKTLGIDLILGEAKFLNVNADIEVTINLKQILMVRASLNSQKLSFLLHVFFLLLGTGRLYHKIFPAQV